MYTLITHNTIVYFVELFVQDATYLQQIDTQFGFFGSHVLLNFAGLCSLDHVYITIHGHMAAKN